VASGVCRVRGELWVVLSGSDPPEARAAVLAGALRAQRGDWLESRYLAPALREWLGGGPGEGPPEPDPPCDPRSGENTG
jgi:hypothetical protein